MTSSRVSTQAMNQETPSYDEDVLQALVRNKAWQVSPLQEWWLPHEDGFLLITKQPSPQSCKVAWINKEQYFQTQALVPWETATYIMNLDTFKCDLQYTRSEKYPTTEVVEHMWLVNAVTVFIHDYPEQFKLPKTTGAIKDCDNIAHNTVFDAAINQLRTLVPWVGPLIDSVHAMVPQESRRAHIKKVFDRSLLLEGLNDNVNDHGLMEPWLQSTVWLTHWQMLLPAQNALYALDDKHYFISDIANEHHLHLLSVDDAQHASLTVLQAYNAFAYDNDNPVWYQARPLTMAQWHECMNNDLMPVFTSTSKKLPHTCSPETSTRLASNWIYDNELHIPNDLNEYYFLTVNLQHWALKQWSTQNSQHAGIIESLVGELPQTLMIGSSPEEDSSVKLQAWGVAARECIAVDQKKNSLRVELPAGFAPNP